MKNRAVQFGMGRNTIPLSEFHVQKHVLCDKNEFFSIANNYLSIVTHLIHHNVADHQK